jgi:hypothetical protein
MVVAERHPRRKGVSRGENESVEIAAHVLTGDAIREAVEGRGKNSRVGGLLAKAQGRREKNTYSPRSTMTSEWGRAE